ncbi:unnamed protein product [Notodromas monacha]|uniref:Uncharacterized protein n=1 Tax=Notodromas monacha TaxID=399045 RepID=A0A7R9GL40_9CRUS|nr:unnamed protein product [Notodromas monacha]CAG0924525.1 unnamed protein product [Notodromas monacha]
MDNCIQFFDCWKCSGFLKMSTWMDVIGDLEFESGCKRIDGGVSEKVFWTVVLWVMNVFCFCGREIWKVWSVGIDRIFCDVRRSLFLRVIVPCVGVFRIFLLVAAHFEADISPVSSLVQEGFDVRPKPSMYLWHVCPTIAWAMARSCFVVLRRLRYGCCSAEVDDVSLLRIEGEPGGVEGGNLSGGRPRQRVFPRRDVDVEEFWDQYWKTGFQGRVESSGTSTGKLVSKVELRCSSDWSVKGDTLRSLTS